MLPTDPPKKKSRLLSFLEPLKDNFLKGVPKKSLETSLIGDQGTFQLGTLSVDYRFIGYDIFFYQIIGTGTNDVIPKIFAQFDNLLTKNEFQNLKYHFAIVDLSKLRNATAEQRKGVLEESRKLNLKFPCRFRVIIGLTNPFQRAAMKIMARLFPMPVAIADSLEDAKKLIKEKRLKENQEKGLAQKQKTSWLTWLKQFKQHEVENLLQYIGNIDWESKGFSNPNASAAEASGALRPVYDAVTILKQDFDDIIKDKNQAEAIVAKQNRFNLIRNKTWKLSADRRREESLYLKELLQTFYTYGELTYLIYLKRNPTEIESLQVALEFKPEEAQSLGEIDLPIQVLSKLTPVDEATILSLKTLKNLNAQELKKLRDLKAFFPKLTQEYKTLVIPLKPSGRIEGYWVFINKESSSQALDEAFKNLASEVMSIVENTLSTRKTERVLNQSPKVLNDIIENSPSLIWVADSLGRYQFANSKWLDIFGKDEALILGKTNQEIFTEVETHLTSNLSDLSTEVNAQTTEQTLWIKNKSRIYLVNLFPIRDTDGVVYATAGIATDISQQKKAETDLAKKDYFLQAIASSVSVLIMEPEIKEAIPKALNILGEAAETDGVYFYIPQVEEHKSFLFREYHWTQPGITFTNDFNRLYEEGPFSGLIQTVKNKQVVSFNTSQLKAPLKNGLEASSTKSILGIPVFSTSELFI